MNSTSERSDADLVIVEQVCGIVKRDCPEQSEGRSAGVGGAGEGGAAPLPCFLVVEGGTRGPLPL